MAIYILFKNIFQYDVKSSKNIVRDKIRVRKCFSIFQKLSRHGNGQIPYILA